MKKLITTLLIIALAFSMIPMAIATTPITVAIDGEEVTFANQQPIIIDGRTLVPVRGVFEAAGFNVAWDGTTSTATLTNNNYKVSITIGNDTFTTNGITHTLDVPAQVINGSTMLPIRAVLESVGFSMDWDSGHIEVGTDYWNVCVETGDRWHSSEQRPTRPPTETEVEEDEIIEDEDDVKEEIITDINHFDANDGTIMVVHRDHRSEEFERGKTLSMHQLNYTHRSISVIDQYYDAIRLVVGQDFTFQNVVHHQFFTMDQIAPESRWMPWTWVFLETDSGFDMNHIDYLAELGIRHAEFFTTFTHPSQTGDIILIVTNAIGSDDVRFEIWVDIGAPSMEDWIAGGAPMPAGALGINPLQRQYLRFRVPR